MGDVQLEQARAGLEMMRARAEAAEAENAALRERVALMTERDQQKQSIIDGLQRDYTMLSDSNRLGEQAEARRAAMRDALREKLAASEELAAGRLADYASLAEEQVKLCAFLDEAREKLAVAVASLRSFALHWNAWRRPQDMAKAAQLVLDQLKGVE